MKEYFLVLMVFCLSGCVFIVKDNEKVKYYGVKQDQGAEIMQQLQQRQEETKDKPPLINIK
jgi:uncharacterized protein YceK